MNDAQQLKPKFRLKTLFWITALIAVPLAFYVAWDHAMDRFFHDMLVGDTGPITSIEEWPRPLTSLAEETSLINAEQLDVYCLCQGFDPEYVWRMPCDDESFAKLISRWQLSEVTNPNWHILRGASHNSGNAPPPWWNPTQLRNVTYFACPQTLGGHKGDRFQVAYDNENSILFVHYWFNF